MKCRICTLLGSIFLIIALSACNLNAGRPQTWIDRPLDKTSHPLVPLTLQAHASDVNGIENFEFYVNNVLLSSVSGNGERLSEALIQWTPPNPGIYTIQVRSLNGNGNPSGYASSVIIIDAALNQLTLTPEQPNMAIFTATVDTDPLCSLTQLVAPELLEPTDNANITTPAHLAWRYPDVGCHPHSWRIDISELTDFSDIGLGFGTFDQVETSRDWPLPAGTCYYWRVLAYSPDEYGPPSAVRKFCIQAPPTATATSTVPPVITFTATVITDTTPPFFIGTRAFPDNILTAGSGCPSYARTTIAEAHVVDTDAGGGVSGVWAVWNVGGESGQIVLSSIGGDYYQGTVGPVNTIGTLSITIYAQDMVGNNSQSNALSVTVGNCIQ